MDLMSDDQLELLIASKGARKLDIVKSGDKQYYLVVTLATGEARGVRTQRGGQRTWASMDRLVEKLQSLATEASVKLPPINLVLAQSKGAKVQAPKAE